MRSTVRVFLKTELRKRETSRAKEAKDSAPPTPVDPRPNTQAITALAGGPAVEPVKDATAVGVNGSKEPEQLQNLGGDVVDQKPETQESSEVPRDDVC